MWKLSRHSESAHTDAFGSLTTMPNSKENPISGGVKYKWGGKIGDFRTIFDVYGRLSRKRCYIGRWLLSNANGYRFGRYNFRWPWVTLNPVFRVTGYFQVEYLQNGALYGPSYYRTLIVNHSRSIEWQHFGWPWVTSDPDFKVTTLSSFNISETTPYRDVVTIER